MLELRNKIGKAKKPGEGGQGAAPKAAFSLSPDQGPLMSPQ